MTRLILTSITVSFGLLFACSLGDRSQSRNDHCECDTLKARQIIISKAFNRIPQYDTSAFPIKDFYDLDSSINRMLWYRDIENIDTTRFTRLWNSYAPANYHASHLDFLNFYTNKKDVELAFQFGPNMDLWAYHIFVIKKVGCCFLVTRSYFRHARFTYKAYGIINSNQLDSLYSILSRVNTHRIGDKEEFKYCGYFIDNRNRKKYFIDFEKEVETVKSDSARPQPKKEIKQLYEFVDNKINWTQTYY